MLAPLLAQAAISSPSVSLPMDSPVLWAGMIVLGIPTVIASINGVLSIINFFKKNPPDHATYATKTELAAQKLALEATLAAQETALSKQIGEVDSRIEKRFSSADTSRNSLDKELKSIHSQLGELFGMLAGTSVDKRRRPSS